MGKSVHNDVLDAALTYVQDNCNKLAVCNAEPTSYTQANVTYSLANEVMTSGDFTIADGDVSGRKVAVDQKAGITVDADGTASHVALLDTTNSKLLYVTTTPSQGVVTGAQLTVGTWDIEIEDPA